MKTIVKALAILSLAATAFAAPRVSILKSGNDSLLSVTGLRGASTVKVVVLNSSETAILSTPLHQTTGNSSLSVKLSKNTACSSMIGVKVNNDRVYLASARTALSGRCDGKVASTPLSVNYKSFSGNPVVQINGIPFGAAPTLKAYIAKNAYEVGTYIGGKTLTSRLNTYALPKDLDCDDTLRITLNNRPVSIEKVKNATRNICRKAIAEKGLYSLTGRISLKDQKCGNHSFLELRTDHLFSLSKVYMKIYPGNCSKIYSEFDYQNGLSLAKNKLTYLELSQEAIEKLEVCGGGLEIALENASSITVEELNLPSIGFFCN